MRLGHGVGQDLGGAGVVLEQEQRVIRAGVRAPEAETVRRDKAGDVGGIEQTRVGVGVLQVPEHLLGEPLHAAHGDVGEGLVPTHFLVNQGTQGHRFGDGAGRRRGVGSGVPLLEVTVDNHQLALREGSPALDGFGGGGATMG
ncbi:hypothetical protein D3C72_1370350 [compost metagenome]